MAVAIGTLVSLVACSNDPPSSDKASGCAPSTGHVTLNYWSWGAGYDKVVQLWNQEHPDITVNFSSIPGGNQGGYTKMFNAAKAGTAPDLGFVEFDTLPAFRSQGDLLDLSPCLKKVDTKDFVPSVWQQTTMGSANSSYAIPLNSGPMVMYYRKDLFAKYGLTPPKTWDDFMADARKVRQVDPSSYLTNFSASSANWFTALAAQKGGQWFNFSDNSWNVNFHDPATLAVANYWSGLIKEHDVSTIQDFSPQWSANLASGKQWTWVSAAWGAGILKASAPKTSGEWAVAPMPRWTDGTASANWGGGGLTVSPKSKHPYEATEFAYWVATDPAVMKILKDSIGIYPVSEKLLQNPVFKQGDPFFGGQNIFDPLGSATQDLAPFTWGPSMATTYSTVSDDFGRALGASGADLSNALQAAQSSVLTDLKRQGISATGR